MGVLALEVLEGVQVPGRWVARFGARDVEAAHPLVAVAYGQLGDLAGHRGVPEGGEDLPYDDLAAVGPHRLGRVLEAGLDGLDDLVQAEPRREVLLGRIAHLRVDDPVGGQVCHALLGHSLEVRTPLHHRDRVLEGGEVPNQAAGAGRVDEPPVERLRRLSREGVTDLGGDLHDRLRP